jgi:hypothetical protein
VVLGGSPTDLPVLDRHEVAVAASPERTWEASLASVGRLGRSSAARRYARLVGATPADRSGDGVLEVGMTVPGFEVVEVDAPRRLLLAGRHRFARYSLELDVRPADGGAACRLTSRALFPGPLGRLYRTAVLGSGGHVVAVRRLLDGVRRRAEAG